MQRGFDIIGIFITIKKMLECTSLKYSQVDEFFLPRIMGSPYIPFLGGVSDISHFCFQTFGHFQTTPLIGKMVMYSNGKTMAIDAVCDMWYVSEKNIARKSDV